MWERNVECTFKFVPGDWEKAGRCRVTDVSDLVFAVPGLKRRKIDGLYSDAAAAMRRRL